MRDELCYGCTMELEQENGRMLNSGRERTPARGREAAVRVVRRRGREMVCSAADHRSRLHAAQSVAGLSAENDARHAALHSSEIFVSERAHTLVERLGRDGAVLLCTHTHSADDKGERAVEVG